MSKHEKIYGALVAAFLLALLIANIFAASKIVRIVQIGDWQLLVAVGILTYPITFLATDLICELYGQKRANYAVVLGFFVSVGMLVLIEIGKAVPALDPEQQKVFVAFFQTNIRAVAASMFAYLVAQFLDVRLFHFWKRRTKGKHLWLRNNGSTVGSQFIDTVLVTSILFWGQSPPFMNGATMGMAEILPLIGNGFVFKAVVAAIDTPLLYLGVRLLRPHTTPLSSAPDDG